MPIAGGSSALAILPVNGGLVCAYWFVLEAPPELGCTLQAFTEADLRRLKKISRVKIIGGAPQLTQEVF
jgi:hypothetical protein